MSKLVHRRVILASGSSRRVDLLELLGVEFSVMPSDIDEVVDEDLRPAEIVVDLARQKALDVHSKLRDEDSLVLGADTIVVLDGMPLGKPADRADAERILASLSGRMHRVFTGVFMIGQDNRELSGYEESEVHFRDLEAGEIRAYIDTQEPMDKAGAYALQGAGSAFVMKIDGCYTNVIGLPVPLTVSMLRRLGIRVLGMP